MVESAKPENQRSHLQQQWARNKRIDDDRGASTPASKARFQRALRKIRMKIKTAKTVSERDYARSMKAEEDEMRRCFHAMDENGNGTLSLEELRDAYAQVGVDLSIELLQQLLRLGRTAQRQKAAGKRQQPVDDVDEDMENITFHDFKSLLNLRKFANWDNSKIGQVTSFDDLPVPLSIVAFGHRRKLILNAYLHNDFRVTPKTAEVSMGSDPADNTAVLVSDQSEDEDLKLLWDRAVALLPPRMQAESTRTTIPDTPASTSNSSGKNYGPTDASKPYWYRQARRSAVSDDGYSYLSAAAAKKADLGLRRSSPSPMFPVLVQRPVSHNTTDIRPGPPAHQLGGSLLGVQPLLPSVASRGLIRPRMSSSVGNPCDRGEEALPSLFSSDIISSVMRSEADSSLLLVGRNQNPGDDSRSRRSGLQNSGHLATQHNVHRGPARKATSKNKKARWPIHASRQ